jgi:tRNA-2-methylthio-N6-dimethylallyladenosine synthase
MVMKKVYIKTFGCQMNVHDTERMLGVLLDSGYQPTDEPREADLIVFNTCSIREKAEQKFYSQLGRTKHFKRKNPGLRIAVAGCIAQQEGETLRERFPYLDAVIGPQNIARVWELEALGKKILTEDNPDIAMEDLPAYRKEGVSAWVNIMYGCNNFCSYCVVPFTRGRERSRPISSIEDEVRGLVEEGYREVTLLGQNVNSYSGEVGFPVLLRRLNRIEGLERIRFVTSHPKDFGEELIAAMKESEKVCEHIHLPLQSGSDRILQLMNRRYTFGEYMEKIQRLRKEIPDIAITTDIIAGFPSETDQDHRMTVQALREVEFDGIFAFKYSPRPRTRALELEGHLPDEVKAERLQEILQLQDLITEKKNLTYLGRTVQVLVEGRAEGKNGFFTGRTRTNKIVNIASSDEIAPGSLLDVTIEKTFRHSLEGHYPGGPSLS